jgi:hypothetical protein
VHKRLHGDASHSASIAFTVYHSIPKARTFIKYRQAGSVLFFHEEGQDPEEFVDTISRKVQVVGYPSADPNAHP